MVLPLFFFFFFFFFSSFLLSRFRITPPYYTVTDSMGWLVLNCIMYMVLAWYADEVFPGAFGVKRGPCFCMQGSYWSCRTGGGSGEGSGATREEREEERREKRTAALSERAYVPSNDDDVREEERQVIQESYEAGGRRGEIAIELLALRKEFGAFTAGAFFFFLALAAPFRSLLIFSSSPSSSFPPTGSLFATVNGVHLAVDDGQLLCLLGHNGAGKTTTMNMLTGMLPINAGDAMIYGKSCSTEMDDIRSIMGICPQHDVLWDQLTGMEHVVLFAGLRGVERAEIPLEAERRLKEVELWDVRNVQSSAYSGGMRRRLSMAIALIGDPKVVFLDEPTTGMVRLFFFFF